uniref:MFS transporter n=1 Tax=Scandinavium goeteborgense TaxID=1851514 RepID=UPI001357E1DB|nr:MFS transporter [Scandinavium goeteborgense]
MNSLLFALLRALRGHVWLRLLALAFILSSLGNGLTQVVVFGQLLRWQASPTTLTLAWLLATMPGFLGSLIGERLCRTYPPLRLLICCELLGLLALILPLQGLRHHSIPLLLAVQSVEALLAGMSWPALALTFKRGLSAQELPAATAMENLIFASQVLLGTGVGVLLFERVSPQSLLIVDAMSFLAASWLLWLTLQRTVIAADDSRPKTRTPLRWATLTLSQKRSLLLLGCLGIFLLAYVMMPMLSGYTAAAPGAIFVAHLASNVVFALGTFSVLHQFTEDDVSAASAKAWRWQTLSATLVTSITVMLTSQLGAIYTLWCVSFCALLLVGSVLFRTRT